MLLGCPVSVLGCSRKCSFLHVLGSSALVHCGGLALPIPEVLCQWPAYW